MMHVDDGTYVDPASISLVRINSARSYVLLVLNNGYTVKVYPREGENLQVMFDRLMQRIMNSNPVRK